MGKLTRVRTIFLSEGETVKCSVCLKEIDGGFQGIPVIFSYLFSTVVEEITICDECINGCYADETRDDMTLGEYCVMKIAESN